MAHDVLMEAFPIAGGGPAGAAAALAMAKSGARPVIFEKSAFPRHKVCGEFHSPQMLPALDELGMAGEFERLKPSRVTHGELHFAARNWRFRLSEPGWGLSRYRFDHFLLEGAVRRGAVVRREPAPALAGPSIEAHGRTHTASRGGRLFGYKAHFTGAANDAVELYFFRGGYCGLCPIENGRTNVCGLASEEILRSGDFDIDRLAASVPHLANRLQPLSRTMDWLVTGPLNMGKGGIGSRRGAPSTLVAGDAARFVDPFTGTGLLAAVRTGAWAGEAALRARNGEPWENCAAWYSGRCSAFYRRLGLAAAVIRGALRFDCADQLAALVPGSLLFRITRPAAQF